MLKFLKKHKGKLGVLYLDILLLCWWIPWHYGRYIYMVENDYAKYLIWNHVGCSGFFTVFVVSFVFIIGCVMDWWEKELE